MQYFSPLNDTHFFPCMPKTVVSAVGGVIVGVALTLAVQACVNHYQEKMGQLEAKKEKS